VVQKIGARQIRAFLMAWPRAFIRFREIRRVVSISRPLLTV
jgi:hypothetical protein